MRRIELLNALRYIVYNCDKIVNNKDYTPDDYTNDIVEDIGEVCNRMLDGDYGYLIEDCAVEQIDKLAQAEVPDAFIEGLRHVYSDSASYYCDTDQHSKYLYDIAVNCIKEQLKR